MLTVLLTSVPTAVVVLMMSWIPTTTELPTSSKKDITLKEKIAYLLESFSNDAQSLISKEPKCGGLTETSTGGRIKYPDYGIYDNDVLCQWKIQAPKAKVLEIRIEFLSIEIKRKTCDLDKLEILSVHKSNSTSLLVEFCGFEHPTKAIISPEPEVLVRFTSDGSIGYGGFELSYSYIPTQQKPVEDSCSGIHVVIGRQGLIRFQNSGKSGENLVCKWKIVGPLKTQVQVSVTWLNMTLIGDDNNGCCDDEVLVVRDGDSETSPQLGSLWHDSAAPPSKFLSSDNMVLISLTSDSGAAFQIDYRTLAKKRNVASGICEGQVIDVSGSSGMIMSPEFETNSYPSSVQCKWKIRVDTGKVISLTFYSMDLEDDKLCRYDSLMVCNGVEPESSPESGSVASKNSDTQLQIIGKYCGNKIPDPITSTGSEMTLTFTSDDTFEKTGFSLGWRAVSKNVPVRAVTTPAAGSNAACSATTAELIESMGFIYSPVAQNSTNYPFATECHWRIAVDAGSKILLTFKSFCMEPPTGKVCYDAVAIYDGPDDSSDSFGVYCGNDTPPDITSTSNYLHIWFLSDNSIACTGFVARYAAIKISSTTERAIPYDSVCGVPDVMPLVYTRIVGGVESIPHSWPWQCSIRYKIRNGEHWCGCAIVKRCWVLTAAHCMYYYGNASNFFVVAGEHNQMYYEGTEVTMQVKRILIHPQYQPDTNDHDLALLELLHDLPFGRAIKSVCLPSGNVPVPDGTLCVVTGWGDTRQNGTSGKSNVLNQLHVPILNHDLCNQKGWYNGELTNTMICAGFVDGLKDSCQGDSGGPLVRQVDGKWYLIGVTSWGFDCAQPNHPGIYTNIAVCGDWIKSQTSG